MSLRIWIVISLFLITIFSSCSKQPSAILDDTDCDAPCWRGIKPGTSTFQEVKTIVSKMSDVEENSLSENIGATNPYLERGIDWRFSGVEEYIGGVYFRGDQATLIDFGTDNWLKLSDFIKKFGEPTDIFIQSTKGDPFVYLTADIIYSEKGICLHHSPIIIYPFENPKIYRIKTTTKITVVTYVDPSLTNGQILSGCLRRLDEATYLKNKQFWNGYGEYDVYTWD